LGEPLPEARNSLVDIVLKFDRVVKGDVRRKGIFCLRRHFRRFNKPLEGAYRLVVHLDLFGPDSGFAFELLGGHEKVEQGNQRLIDGGQEGLFLDPLKAVIADILADDGAVFLLDEAVVVLLVVAASGKGDAVVFAPDFRGVVDKFRAVIAVELIDRDKGGCFDVCQSLESPFMGVIEQGTQFNPARGDVGGGQSVQVLALSGLPAVVNGVDLPKTGLLALLAGVKSTDGDAAFQGIQGFREAFPFQPEGRLVFFEVAVYGC